MQKLLELFKLLTLNLEPVEVLTLCQPQCMHDQPHLYHMQACLMCLPHRTEFGSVCLRVGPTVTGCKQAAAHTVPLHRPFQVCQDWPLLRPTSASIRLASPCCAFFSCTYEACMRNILIALLHACKLEIVMDVQEANV